MNPSDYPSFQVSYRWDSKGVSARNFQSGGLEFISSETTGEPVLRTKAEKNGKTALFRLTLLKSLSPRLPEGSALTLPFSDGNLYLKFPTREDLKKFHEVLIQRKKSIDNASQSNMAPGRIMAARRSNNRAAHASSYYEQNSVVESQENGTNSTAAPPTNMPITETNVPIATAATSENNDRDESEPVDFLFGVPEALGTRTKSTGIVLPPERPQATVPPFIDLVRTAASQEKDFAPPDKENYHKTPTKNPSFLGVNSRRPLANRFGSTGSIKTVGSTASAPSCSIVKPIVRDQPPIGTIPGLLNFPSHQTKRPADTHFTELFSSQKKPRSVGDRSGLKGFNNLGNTCYMNAVLQAIFGLDPFASDLTKAYKYIEPQVEEMPSLFRFLAMLLTYKNKENELLKDDYLRGVKNSLVCKTFVGSKQKDAHEFFVELLDQLKEEVAELVKRIESSVAVGSVLSPNPVQNNFEFIITNTLTCTGCKAVSEVDEYYSHCSLDFSEAFARGRFLLQSMLDNFLSYGGQQVERTCEVCGSKTAFSTFLVKKPPRILVLHMKRKKYHPVMNCYVKINQKIVVPRFLTLRHLCPDIIEFPSLLVNSTKKACPVSKTPNMEDAETRNENPEPVRRQLFDGNDAPSEPFLEERKYSFRRPSESASHYSTRSATHGGSTIDYRETDPADDEDYALLQALERSKTEYGPPAFIIDGNSSFDSEQAFAEAIRLSLLEMNQNKDDDAIPLVDVGESLPSMGTENDTEEFEDPEMALNAEDGHLEPAYRLCSMVNFSGVDNRGHYTADVLDIPTSTWHSFNDSIVQEISEDIVLKEREETGTMFFYMEKNIFDKLRGHKSDT